MQFLLWTTLVVTIIYTMLTRAETGSSMQAIKAAILNAEVARLAEQGWTVGGVSAGQGILQRKKRIGWFWNTVLTLLTGGLWLIVVIVRVVNRKIETRVVTVDARPIFDRGGGIHCITQQQPEVAK